MSISSFLYECFYYAIEFMKYAVIFRMVFRYEIRKKWQAGVGVGLLILFIGGYYSSFEQSYEISMFLYISVMIAQMVCIFYREGSWWRWFAIWVWVFATITMIDGISYMLISVINPKPLELHQFMTSVLTILIEFLIFKIAQRKNKNGLKNISLGYYAAFTIIGLLNLALLSPWFEYENQYAVDKWTLILLWISIIAQMTMILTLAVSRNVWREKEALNSYYLSIQQQHYRYLENREEQTKSFRHDLRSHLYILGDFLEKGDLGGARDYLRKTYDVVDSPQRGIYIGHPIVDAILTHYLSICEEKKIHYEIKGHMPVSCTMSAFDLCTVFSNLLQNAVDAVEECEEKIISMLFRYDGSDIFVKIENTYQKLCYEGGRLVSTKGDSHGYGINNVQRSVAKYGGMIEYEEKNGRFVTFLQLPHTVGANERPFMQDHLPKPEDVRYTGNTEDKSLQGRG